MDAATKTPSNKRLQNLANRYNFTPEARRFQAGWDIGLRLDATVPLASDHPTWALGWRMARERLAIGQHAFFQKYGISYVGA